MARNPQAATLLVVTQLEGMIKPPLNEWAVAGGEPEKVAAAGAGLCAYVVQTGTLMASAASDQAAMRRMVATMLATAISAALGSEEARKQLKEMCPFWSWLVMGEDIAVLWEGRDYYGGGKRVGELIVQVIGDVTILVPIVKGATLAIKGSTTVQAVQAKIVQAFHKTGSKIGRTKGAAMEGASDGIRCLTDFGCFPAGTEVLMADGSWCAIEQIVEGDMVMADEPLDSVEPAPQKVVGILEGWSDRRCEIRLSPQTHGDVVGSGQAADSVISSTTEHPFWVESAGWVRACDLKQGDQLRSPEGVSLSVRSIEVFEHVYDTWNLTVDGCHAFFVRVADTAVLVHNTKPGPRVYLVYRVDLPDGSKYVGRTSMHYTKGMDYDTAAREALKTRFKRHHRAAKHLGFSENNAKIIWSEVYDTGNINDKRKAYGTMRGVEHLEEAKWANKGLSANRKVPRWKLPIGVKNKDITKYLDLAFERARLKCPGR